jgi:hypothetical protein
MEAEVQDILELTKTKMREAGEFSREAYREFIEESIEYYLEKGRLSDEDDLDAITEELMAMYEDVKSEEVDGSEFGIENEDEDEEDDEDNEDEEKEDALDEEDEDEDE